MSVSVPLPCCEPPSSCSPAPLNQSLPQGWWQRCLWLTSLEWPGGCWCRVPWEPLGLGAASWPLHQPEEPCGSQSRSW